MEDHQKESLRALGPGTIPNHPMTPRPHDQCDPEGRPEKDYIGGGRSNGGATGSAPPPLHKKAWHRMKGWYKAAVDRMQPPSRVSL